MYKKESTISKSIIFICTLERNTNKLFIALICLCVLMLTLQHPVQHVWPLILHTVLNKDLKHLEYREYKNNFIRETPRTQIQHCYYMYNWLKAFPQWSSICPHLDKQDWSWILFITGKEVMNVTVRTFQPWVVRFLKPLFYYLFPFSQKYLHVVIKEITTFPSLFKATYQYSILEQCLRYLCYNFPLFI